MISKFLGDIFNLFPLGGSTGGIVVRQKGGVAGTDEVQIYDDGTQAFVQSKNGIVLLTGSNGTSGDYVKFGVTAESLAYIRGEGVVWSANRNGRFLCVNGSYNWASGYGQANDTSLFRAAAGVAAVGTGNESGSGWLQNTAGRSRVTTTDVTNTSTTFAAITGLTATLIAGRKYSGWVALKVNSATAADGIKFDFNGGTATMTNFWAAMYPIAGAPATKGVDLSTALSTALTFTAMGDTNDAVVLFSVNLVCNAAGTFIPEFALNSGSGTATVRVSSAMWLDDIP